jgi:hypothetical protein
MFELTVCVILLLCACATLQKMPDGLCCDFLLQVFAAYLFA